MDVKLGFGLIHRDINVLRLHSKRIFFVRPNTQLTETFNPAGFRSIGLSIWQVVSIHRRSGRFCT